MDDDEIATRSGRSARATASVAVGIVLQGLVIVFLVDYAVAHHSAAAAGLAFLVQILTVAVVWRRRRSSLGRRYMRACFDFNPDIVAIYDGAGFLRYSNPARNELFDLRGGDGIGAHFSSVLEPAALGAAAAAFERASAGETATTGGHFKRVSGGIDFEAALYPYVVDGVQRGVVVVSKDVGALKAASIENELQAKRIAALYEIASAHGRTTGHQMREALALAAEHLECETGAATEVIGDRVHILATFGELAGVEVGSSMAVEKSVSRLILAHPGVWSIRDLLELDDRGRAISKATGLRSAVGLSIKIDGETFGTFVVASVRPRTAPFREIDRGFVRVVAALLGTMIERSRQERKLDSLAFFDALTGLANRSLVNDKLDRLIVDIAEPECFAVHFVDLDRFKSVNDVGGHNAGDEVLRLVAARLKQCVRESDTVARLGGDEFVILQRGAGDRDVASHLAKRIIAAIERPYIFEGRTYSLGCSVGISFYPADGTDSSTLLDLADRAMYRAKVSAHPEFASTAGDVVRAGRDAQP